MWEEDEEERAVWPNLLARSTALLLAAEVSTRSRDGLSRDERSRGVEGVELRSSSRYDLLYVGRVLSSISPTSRSRGEARF